MVVVTETFWQEGSASAQKTLLSRAMTCQEIRKARGGDVALTRVHNRRGELLAGMVEHDLIEVPHRTENEVPEVRP